MTKVLAANSPWGLCLLGCCVLLGGSVGCSWSHLVTMLLNGITAKVIAMSPVLARRNGGQATCSRVSRGRLYNRSEFGGRDIAATATACEGHVGQHRLLLLIGGAVDSVRVAAQAGLDKVFWQSLVCKDAAAGRTNVAASTRKTPLKATPCSHPWASCAGSHLPVAVGPCSIKHGFWCDLWSSPSWSIICGRLRNSSLVEGRLPRRRWMHSRNDNVLSATWRRLA